MSASTKAPDIDRGATRATKEEPPAQAFGEAIRAFGELRAYVAHYIASRLDQVKLTVRNVIIYAALGIVGLVAAATVVVMAVVQILGGIAGGIGQIFPSHAWLGNIITGLVVLGVVFVGVKYGITFIGRMSRTAIVAKYEAFKREQRQQFGRSVDDGAN